MHPAYRGNILDILGGEIRLHPSRKGMMSFLVIVPGVSRNYGPRASAGAGVRPTSGKSSCQDCVAEEAVDGARNVA